MPENSNYVLDTNQIRYTRHALGEMYAQGMLACKVERTLATGALQLESKRQNKWRAMKRFGNELWHVIFRIEPGLIVIINCKRVRT